MSRILPITIRVLRSNALSVEQVQTLLDGGHVRFGGVNLYIWTHHLARDYGHAHGYKGRFGGWIYKDGRQVCQGWTDFYRLHQSAIHAWVWAIRPQEGRP